MALFNNFPYTDLNDINLDYTLQKLESLYTRGEQLYSTLTTWQQTTDAELEQWKAATESALALWKTQTENSIDNKIQLLTAAINTAFTELRTQLEAHIAEIETTAVNAASDASASATAAAGAASAASINNEQSKEWAIGETLEGDPVPDTNPAYENNAKYYADLLGQETEQIDQNTADITDLKSAITSANYLYDYTISDGVINTDGTISSPSATLKEKYTSRLTIPDDGHIGVALEYPTAGTMWLAYALYNANDEFIVRTQIISSTAQSYNDIRIINNSNAKYIRFTFRGYDSYKFNIYNAISYDLDNVSADTEKIKSDIGVYEITFNVTASTAHGADFDHLPVNIKANEVYKVDIASTAITGGQIYAFYADGTNERVYSGNYLHQVFTATKDINAFSLYVAAQFIPNSGNVTMTVTLCGYALTLSGVDINYCANLKSINHRGFTAAPENTLPAFKLSRKMGFMHVETDILWTSDDVPVLLHDFSINRTARNADGTTIADTTNIADITYAQALTYDFGIYKGTQYAGTKIPTFTEFIILCKQLGLHPYVELKGGSQEQINGLVDITERYGMTDKISWTSFYTAFLNRLKNRYPKARLGFVAETFDASKIAEGATLKTSDNDVFLLTNYTHVTTAIIEACVTAQMALEIYTIDNINDLLNTDPYISGYISNSLLAGKVIYDANIN